MGQLLDKYGIDGGIVYKDGEPDFSEVSKGTVEIEPFSTERTDNFDKADLALAQQKVVHLKKLHNGAKTIITRGTNVRT